MSRRDDLADAHEVVPEGVDPIGVPTRRSGQNAFIVTAAAVGALLGLIFTLSWIVYHQIAPVDGEQQQPPGPTGETVVTPVEPTVPT